MSGIEGSLTAAIGWIKPFWQELARAAATLWHRAVSLWFDIRDRHLRLMDEDPRYPVALASGGAAVVKVMVANPSVVKAITVLLADLLGSQDTSRASDRPAWQARTPWSPGRDEPTSRSSLWDRDDWEEDE